MAKCYWRSIVIVLWQCDNKRDVGVSLSPLVFPPLGRVGEGTSLAG